MAVSPADVLTEMQSRTGRTDVTSITVPLRYIVKDMTRRVPLLKASGSLTYVADTYSYVIDTALSVLHRAVEGISDTNGLPLERIVNLEKWMMRRGDGTSKGEPCEFYIRAGSILVNPVPDVVYTHTIYYSTVHPEDVATILLDDECFEAIVSGVCWRVWMGKGQGKTEGIDYREDYETELAKLARKIPGESHNPTYHDV